MAEHTPGPWEMCEVGDYADFDGKSRVICADDIRICAVHADGDAMAAENEANARLIAAAPDLLAALQKIIDMNVQYCIDRYGDATQAETMACVTTARAAIARATGQAA